MKAVWFTGPQQVTIREAETPQPDPEQVLVRTLASALSPGTEMLIYRGDAPADMAADSSIEALGGSLAFPLKYGYACVGEVIACGEGIAPEWLGRQVFAFTPHETLFAARPSDLLPIPDGVSLEQALFLPNMETAVNLLHDGAPRLGERVLVFGQGVVGLLTAALLAHMPLEVLATVDRHPLRRDLSRALGAGQSFSPGDDLPADMDLTYEVSGAPAALDAAIAATGFAGRIVIGSWYGRKTVSLDLGGHFHRSRIRLLSSQVSSIDPTQAGRWTKSRRFETAWAMIRAVGPERLITHRFPFVQAADAYRLLDEHPDQTVQIVLTYS
ncbi:MAG: zinc-binding alcohol dehydrogenase [Anaerolineae bacterium]